MKRLVIVLSSLLVLPAFAEVVPSYYEDDTVFTDVELDDVDTGAIEANSESEVQPVSDTKSTSGGRVATGRTTTGRVSSTRNARTPSARSNTVRSRSISVRGATPVRTTSVSARHINDVNGNANSEKQTSKRKTTARAATVTSTTPLYNANSVTSRANTGRASSVTTRSSAMRSATVSSTVTPTADSAIDTTAELNTLKSLTEYCQAQYASCMDNYCNVLDDNQGRCSCSKNIAKYEKTEAALVSATEALQDVARSIQYIGLSADQITTLFTETEAELTMKDSKDNSAIRSSLDKVKRMIVDVKPGTASASESTNTMNFDLSGLLNFDIDNSGFDFTSFMSTSSSNNSISNQRGESLYKTASARCKASVLNSCTAQGVDAAVITNAYDLEIDKSCLAYERALTESNTNMAQTVANAKEVLKKARLAVAQNKNAYDLRSCVSELESCMQDDYVCGSDYSNCLDPTGQYIVNGSVVIGSMPGQNSEAEDYSNTTYSHDRLFDTWTTSDSYNPWVGTNKTAATDNPKYISLVDYIEKTVKSGVASSASDKMSAYLQNKIGYHNDKENKDYGMCMSVLNKCQDYTYTTNSKGSKYNPTNDVIKQFLQRALVQIKMAQDDLLTSYAESCISDVSSCLSSNNYDASNPEGTKSRTAINSCYSQIKTCMSVNGNIYGKVNPEVMRNWVTGNYSSIEIYQSTESITHDCETITEEDDCKAARGYCDTGDKVTSLNNGGSICTWTPASGNTKGSCSLASGVTCEASSSGD